MAHAPALRLRGRAGTIGIGPRTAPNARIRAYRIGRWNRDPLNEVAAFCRSSVAVDKALVESVRSARHAGRSWPEIAVALGLSADLATWAEISAGLAARRQVILGRHGDEA